MAVRFKSNANLSEALDKTAGVIKAANPGFPFEYHFCASVIHRSLAGLADEE